MTAAEHFTFIAWSYAGAGLMTVGLIAYVVWDALRVKRKLAALEKSGVRRRSAGASTP